MWTQIKTVKLGELNELAYEELFLLINTSSSVGKVAFGLVKNTKSADFPQGNCKIALDRLVSQHAPHSASSLLKLKRKFHNRKQELIEEDPDKQILNLEGLQIQMNKFRQKGNIMEEDFMIHILNNYPEEYDMILDGLENCLMTTGEDGLTINVI